MIEITILDPVDIKINKEGRERLAPTFTYTAEYFKPGPYRSERKQYEKCVISRSGVMHTGFIPRIKLFCEQRQIEYKISGDEVQAPTPLDEPKLPGIEFRPDQLRLINSAVEAGRGVIKSPTGTGKTITMLGILSRYPKSKALILVPTLDLLTQTTDEMARFAFHRVSVNKVDDAARIIIATKQTWARRRQTSWADDLDIVIIDECHIGMSEGSEYEKILRDLVCPIRLGFTASPPKDPSVVLNMEGLLGPIVGEVTIEEGARLDILETPELQLISVPHDAARLDNIRTYKEIYDSTIVNNGIRNRLILRKARQLMAEGMSVLIFITNLKHGENLVTMAEDIEMEVAFVRGATDRLARAELKAAVQAGKMNCVISSKVWREGVNIPNLGAVILAGGGRTEMGTIQAIGRGLRKAEGKEKAVVVDFLDEYKHVSSHTVARLKVYVSQGWL